MDKAALLARIPLFSRQRPEALDRLAGLTAVLAFAEGEVVVREGSLDKRFFVVLKGEVEVVKGLGRKGQKRLQRLGPADHFGEMALIDDRGRSASVVAVADTETLCLDQLDFHREIRENPQLALDLLRTMSLRLRAMNTFALKSLGQIPPICLTCQKICEQDRWVDIETYIEHQAGFELQQTICPACSISKFPRFYTDPEPPAAKSH